MPSQKKNNYNKLQSLPLGKEVLKYFSASFLTYIFVFTSLYVMVEIIKLSPQVGFFITYLLAYILAFFLQSLIFKSKKFKSSLGKFLLHIAFFFSLGNLLFYVFQSLGLSYMISTVCLIVLIFPLRFLSSKYFVFKS